MQDKNQQINDYINKVVNNLSKYNAKPTNKQIEALKKLFLNREEDVQVLIKEIDKMVKQYLDNLRMSASIKEKEAFQKFNLHTHTNRCGHASIASEKEYVKSAKEVGLKLIGFTDHIPYTENEFPENNQRMHISEVDEYIESVNELKDENEDIEILIGFEAEYSDSKKGFLSALRNKVDYMILGQHYIERNFKTINQNNNPEYPIIYAEEIVKALESGIFDIVAHPDYFMKRRNDFETIEDKEKFLENARIASKMICEKAKELNIPLEINFAGIDLKTKGKDQEYDYPHSLFWDIAASVGVPVLYGVDAHHPEQIYKMNRNKKLADKIIDSSSLNVVPEDYNPVVYRQNNELLQQKFDKTRKTSKPYQQELQNFILNQIESTISDEERETQISLFTDKIKASIDLETAKRLKASERKLEQLQVDKQDEEKEFFIKREQNTIEHIQEASNNRLNLLESTKEKAINKGNEKPKQLIKLDNLGSIAFISTIIISLVSLLLIIISIVL